MPRYKLSFPFKDPWCLVRSLGVIALFPFLLIANYPIYLLAVLFSLILPNYGKFLSNKDVCLVEDFVTTIPRHSIVVTLTLDGNITLSKLRNLFTTNVLEAKSSIPGRVLRYPELKQYLTSFLGFQIWKNDPHFKIDNHILEGDLKQHLVSGEFITGLHQDLINKKYKKEQSPWEITLLRNVPVSLLDMKNSDGSASKICVLACRIHHCMADGKSIVKLFVEALGNQSLTTGTPKYMPITIRKSLTFFPLLPFTFLKYIGHLVTTAVKSDSHPWKLSLSQAQAQQVETVIAFGPKLKISEIKQVATRNQVTSSAVIMASIAGGIRKFDEQLGKGKCAIGYPLPKPNHPEFLTNHMYAGIFNLPTDKSNVYDRLQECEKALQQAKLSDQGKHMEVVIFITGRIFPMSPLRRNYMAPVGITNIAGESIGFSVGHQKCIDFRMSVGVTRGVDGVVFCAFSYKGEIRVAVAANGKLLKGNDVKVLADHVVEEFVLLKNI